MLAASEDEEIKEKTAMYHDDEDMPRKPKRAMDDDEEDDIPRKAKRAADDEDDEEMKKAADDEEEDEEAIKRARRAKRAADNDGGDDDQDTKVASLTATVDKLRQQVTIMKAKPLIEGMLAARIEKGMPEQEALAFKHKLMRMPLKSIMRRHQEDSWLTQSVSIPSTPESIAIPFNGGLYASVSGKSMEEILDGA